MTARKSPNLETKLAAALLTLGDVPYEHAKQMTASQINSLYQYDHNIRHDDGGPLEPWNLTPRLIVAHRVKTGAIDAPELAKGRDIRASEAVHAAALASKAGDYVGAAVILAGVKKKSRLKPKRKIPSRPFQSRNTFQQGRA